MKMKSIREIKSLARQTLQGRFSAFITLLLSGYLIQSVIVSLPSALLAVPESLPLFLSQILLTFLLQALGAMVVLGISRGALQLVRGQQFGFQDLLFAFSHQADHFLALELILTAIQTFTSVPGFVFSWISGSEMNFLTYSVYSGLFSGLSAVLTFLITLVFSMSEFIMLDHPELTAKEALTGSMELLRGHTGRYFFLILSFIGFILLGFTSAMIGFIWVIPYLLVSEAIFYENLRELASGSDYSE